MAIARSKDNEGTNASDEPTIREIVREPADLQRKIEQLDHAVSRFDARYRLYLSANARHTTTAVFDLRSRMDEWIRMRLGGNEEVIPKFGRVDSEFKSVLQSDGCKDDTNFIFDLDDATAEEAAAFRERLTDHTTVRMARETPNGFHIITEPFDYNELDAETEYELKTDDMIFLAFAGD